MIHLTKEDAEAETDRDEALGSFKANVSPVITHYTDFNKLREVHYITKKLR